MVFSFARMSTTFGLVGVSVAIAVPPAAGKDFGRAEEPPKALTVIAQKYLQVRADALTRTGAGNRQRLAAVLVDSMAREFAADINRIDQRRRSYEALDGGKSHAKVTVSPVGFEMRGDEARLDVEEYTELYFARPVTASLGHEAYTLEHTFLFTKSNGHWLVRRANARIAPGSIPPSTQPVEAIGSPEPGAAAPEDTQRPSSTARAELSGALASPLETTTKKQVVDYAERYWRHYNPSYRAYSPKDCTNFVSQALHAGGWSFVGSGVWGRKDYDKWYYGSAVSTTSYTWAAANNWGIFARDKSRRTRHLTNVWDLRPGDILQADLDGSGGKDHSMIVVAMGGGKIYLNYHSNNTWHKKLSELLADFRGAKWYAHQV